MTFAECLLLCGQNRELVAEFDRLHGHNLSMKGTALDIEIDRVTGRMDAGVKEFADVWGKA